ncbi:hypothetical protein [Cytophaga sp. FL35]|uniref:hypothetical protein n=1 Tax=Cytophaga sp. FL35 TaxID=1904456 RepID=UPI001653667A|nr:hypothetical protein [Cytophaga sp. FL35]MBC6999469.1 hypothetical protein [Cytophaga sp. FL35]
MKRKSLKTSLIMGLLVANAAFANIPISEIDELVLDSVDYIEEETDFDLGFDTADYLPEDFNPYKLYVDLQAIDFIEEEESIKIKTSKYLPEGFDAFAYPSHVADFNYIDALDEVKLNFDTKEHLPEGFNPYIKR